MEFRLAAENFEPPRFDRAPCRFGMPVMAGKDIAEPFLMQHVDRFGEAVKNVGGGRIGEKTLGVRRQHVIPLPERLPKLRRLRRFERFLTDRVEGKPRRQHEAFLRTGHSDIDAPFVMPEVDRGK